jgi:CRP-like cAMP-binding protein
LICSHTRGASIRAETPLDVVVVDRRTFGELLGNLPGLSASVQNVMSKRMGRAVDLCREIGDAVNEQSKM